VTTVQRPYNGLVERGSVAWADLECSVECAPTHSSPGDRIRLDEPLASGFRPIRMLDILGHVPRLSISFKSRSCSGRALRTRRSAHMQLRAQTMLQSLMQIVWTRILRIHGLVDALHLFHWRHTVHWSVSMKGDRFGFLFSIGNSMNHVHCLSTIGFLSVGIVSHKAVYKGLLH
jgi:hypothetical protein